MQRKLKKNNSKNYVLYTFCNFVSLMLITAYSAMMFSPTVLKVQMCIRDRGITSAMTKFIIAVVSVTQLLYLSEVGGLILGSKLPVKLWELFVIFLERTIISLIIVCPLAHFIF